MKPYPSYKDSEVEWIGEIPSEWNYTKLKYYSSYKNGFAFKSDSYVDTGIPVIRIGDVKPVIDLNYTKKVPFRFLEELKDYKVEKGDILIALTGATIGKSSVYNIETTSLLNQRVGIVNSSNDLNQELIPYIFILSQFREYVFLKCDGGAQENISTSEIGEFIIPLPPIQEQQQISNYLDQKTQQIDSLIEKTQQKIELLKEQRTSLINQVVKKGLNSDVEMKDSGVEWIGEIPSGWSTVKVKYLGSVNSGDGLDSRLIEPEGEFPVYGGNGVMGFFSNYNSDKETLIIGRVGEKCGNVHYEKSKVWVNDNSLIFNPFLNKPICLEYLFHSLTQRNLNQLRNQNTQPLITGTLVKNENTPIPPIQEQQQIVEYLDEQTQKIDSTIEKETQRIELLKEYRQSLISDVVTGKVDVRDEVLV